MDMLVWALKQGNLERQDCKVVQKTQGPTQKSNPSHSVSPDEGWKSLVPRPSSVSDKNISLPGSSSGQARRALGDIENAIYWPLNLTKPSVLRELWPCFHCYVHWSQLSFVSVASVSVFWDAKRISRDRFRRSLSAFVIIMGCRGKKPERPKNNRIFIHYNTEEANVSLETQPHRTEV